MHLCFNKAIIKENISVFLNTDDVEKRKIVKGSNDWENFMKEKYLSRGEFLFFVALAIYMLAKTIELSSAFYEVSMMPSIMKILRYISYAIIFVKLLYDAKYLENEMLKIVAMVLLLGIISLNFGNNILFCSFLFIIAARNLNIGKLVKAALYIQIILTICMAGLCCFGIISDWTYNLEGRNRHSLGYVYPSYISSIFFYVTLAYLFIRKKKIRFWEIVCIGILNGIIFHLTDSKTSFVLVFLAIIVLWIMKFCKKRLENSLISKLLYVYSIPFIAAISILACYLYNEENKLLILINSFINNRLIMGHNALLEYGLSLFGEKIVWTGNGGLGYLSSSLQDEYNFVDCSYVKILLDYGIIFFIIMIFGYMLVAKRAIEKNDCYMCMCLLFMCIYSMIEPRIIEFGFNPFVLTLSALFGKNTPDDIIYKNEEFSVNDYPIEIKSASGSGGV